MRESRTFLLISTLILIPINGIGTDLYAPSLPAIAHALHATPALTKLTIALYLLGMGLGQSVFGTLSDSWGRRKPIMLALMFYSFFALLGSMATNITFLLVIRTLQGFVSAAPSAISKSILTDTLEGKELTRAFGMLASVWALAPVLAPAAGGYIQHYLGWQANFYALAVTGVVGVVFAYLMPETHEHVHPFRFNVIKVNYKRILTSRIFLVSAAGMVLMYSLMTVFNVMGPYLIQVVMKQNAITNGHVALMLGLGYFLGATSHRHLLRYVDVALLDKVGLYGVLTCSVAMFVFALWHILNLAVIVVPGFLIFYGMGLFYPSCMARALAPFRTTGGTSSAILGTLTMLGTSTASILASFIHLNNQLPLTIIYVVFATASLVVYRMF